MTAAEIVNPLGGCKPPDGTFSVGCVNHRGQGCTIVYQLEEATPLFEQLKGIDGDYPLRAKATAKVLRKYLRRRRQRDARALALGALSTAIASPYCDFTARFSQAVREHNRVAISVVFGKRRGLLIVVGERVYDHAGVLKKATRRGLGPFTIIKAGGAQVFQ